MNDPSGAVSAHTLPQPPERATTTPLSARALAPDLARGLMLLFIALAHVPWFLYHLPAGVSGMHPIVGGAVDRWAQVMTIIAVDARTHTMFAFLFAYGIGQMYSRQRARGVGEPQVRRLLGRRHRWMIVFGALHAVLLWQGDILGTYGLLGLILVPLFLGRSDRTLRVWIVVLLSLSALGALISTLGVLLAPTAAAGVVPADLQRLSMAEPDYVLSALYRTGMWVLGLASGLLTLALPTAFLAGLLAARHRILEEPERHLPLLRRLAVLGIACGVLGGVGLVLEHSGIVSATGGSVFSPLHFLTGIGQGIGYVALFGLVAQALAQRGLDRLVPVQAVVALGRRSLSGYLAQSVLFIPLLAAWGFGLGAHLSSWSAAVVAIATWSLTVVAAYALERSGRRGPAEVLLRKLTYRSGR
ncbi:Putative membrane protein YeiB [Citricoccus sp. K5]|nr:Putative membrane protein YeiB [Citricoccus sp. K5]